MDVWSLNRAEQQSATMLMLGAWAMRKRKVIVEELQPGITRYRPEYKSGILSAVAGYFERKKGRAHREDASRRRASVRAGGANRVGTAGQNLRANATGTGNDSGGDG